jgi:hypothetical protein
MRRLAILVLIAAGALEAWARRHNMAPDGISYLDVAAAYRRGDFVTAINEYWSPLFSWLLSFTVLYKNPDAALSEPARVHALMFVFYLVALTAAMYAVREARLFAESYWPDRNDDETLPQNWWYIVGFALFAWSSFELISLETVNPDILVSAFVITIFALFLRVARGDVRASTALLLGLLLGGAYLAKTVMFLMGIASLGVAAVVYTRFLSPTKALRNAALTVAGFVAVAAPWIVVLSRAKGHLTFGSSGKLNYGWLGDGLPLCCWQGGYGSGMPLHPPRQIFQNPAAFEFATPIHASFPLWFDPTYWYAGVKPPVHVVHAATLFLQNLGTYLPEFGWVIAIIIVVAALAARRQLRIADWRYWTIFALALAPFALYAIVYTETRFVGGSAVAVCLVLLGGIRGEGRAGGIALRSVALALALPAATYAGFRLVADARFAVLNAMSNNSEENAVSRRAVPAHQPPSLAMATGFAELGVGNGTRVAEIGAGANAYWARLAHVDIVVELQARDDFWGRPDRQAAILDAMHRAGAQVVVSDDPPAWADFSGWKKVGSTSAVMLDLRTKDSSAARPGFAFTERDR